MPPYQTIKSWAYKLIPTTLIQKHKSSLRALTAQFYRGDQHQCNICEFRLRAFVQNGADKICPNCGSIGRTRRLYQILHPYLEQLRHGQLLHFSPPASIEGAIKKRLAASVAYVSSDLVGEFDAKEHIDLTDNDLPNNAYDLVICYHVLEHIEQDRKAMAELFRITKPGGTCLIQTPFDSVNGPAIEDNTIIEPAARLQAFGQADHVRVYSVRALRERLAEAGFEIGTLEYAEDSDNYHGFKAVEHVLVAKKVV